MSSRIEFFLRSWRNTQGRPFVDPFPLTLVPRRPSFTARYFPAIFKDTSPFSSKLLHDRCVVKRTEISAWNGGCILQNRAVATWTPPLKAI